MEPPDRLGIAVASERVAARDNLPFSVPGGRLVVVGTGDLDFQRAPRDDRSPGFSARGGQLDGEPGHAAEDQAPPDRAVPTFPQRPRPVQTPHLPPARRPRDRRPPRHRRLLDAPELKNYALQNHARSPVPERGPVFFHLSLRAQLAHRACGDGRAPARARGRGRRHPLAGGREHGAGRFVQPGAPRPRLVSHPAGRLGRQSARGEPDHQRPAVPRACDELQRRGPGEERPDARRLRPGPAQAHGHLHLRRPRHHGRAAGDDDAADRQQRPRWSSGSTSFPPTASASMSSSAGWPTTWRCRSTSSATTRCSRSRSSRPARSTSRRRRRPTCTSGSAAGRAAAGRSKRPSSRARARRRWTSP